MSDIAELSKTPPVSPILWLVLNRQVTSHCVLISTCNCFKYIFANFQILNFHCHIWKQHEKFIQMSTNKPSIGAVVLEITPWILRKHRQIPIFLHSSVESKKCISLRVPPCGDCWKQKLDQPSQFWWSALPKSMKLSNVSYLFGFGKWIS